MSNQNQPPKPLTRPQIMGVISFVSLLLFKLRHSLILYGKDNITQVQPPNRHYQVVVRQSRDWELLKEAAKLANERTLKEWGPEFCRTLCHWLENTRYIFIFHVWADQTGVCTGVTFPFYPGNPVIHIALYDSNGKPRTIRQIAATLLHEIMHLREKNTSTYPTTPTSTTYNNKSVKPLLNAKPPAPSTPKPPTPSTKTTKSRYPGPSKETP